METKNQFEQTGAYESPSVECVEVAVEQGYSASVGTGLEDYEEEQGSWDI